jgi:hypothetical protein
MIKSGMLFEDTSWQTPVRFVASLHALLVGILVCPLWCQSRTANSPELTAAAVGMNCTSDTCSSRHEGCASCVELVVSLPPKAWVTKTHCYTTANYPDDHLRHDLHEVDCGVDNSWSIFDTPIVSATPSRVVIRSTYHNRSSNRSRDVKLTVEWRPIEASQSGSGK